jgi:hypothetical protein
MPRLMFEEAQDMSNRRNNSEIDRQLSESNSMNFIWWIYLFCYVASAVNSSNVSVRRKTTAQTIVADRRRYSMSKNRHHQNQRQNTWVAPLLFQTHCFQNAVPLYRNQEAVSPQSYINILDFRLLTHGPTSSCRVIPYHSHYLLTKNEHT